MEGGINVHWSNGERFVYPYKMLRFLCPCALCVDENSGRRMLQPTSIPDDVIIVDWLTIGRYSLQFLWSDGHETGIYPYTMLLNIAKNI